MNGVLKVLFDAAIAAGGVVLADQIKQRAPKLIDAFIAAATPKIKALVAKIEEKFNHKPKPQQ